MVETPIQDARLSVAGEQARILARALAMRDVLVQQDNTVAEMVGRVVGGKEEGRARGQEQEQEGRGAQTGHHSFPPSPSAAPAAAPVLQQQQQQQEQQQEQEQQQPEGASYRAGSPAAAQDQKSTRSSAAAAPPPANGNDAFTTSKSGSPQLQQFEDTDKPPHHKVHIDRSSNEDEPDATTEECLLSVCLMLAALYEQTPFSESELRRRVFDDFTQLKRHFRSDDLTVLHGRTGSIKELFDGIKDLDKHSGLQNLLGILFEDWQVNKRVDQFILADQITVQVRSRSGTSDQSLVMIDQILLNTVEVLGEVTFATCGRNECSKSDAARF
jgi:hypothetical protein